MLAHDVKDRLTPDEIINHPLLNECETYKTERDLSVSINGSKQAKKS